MKIVTMLYRLSAFLVLASLLVFVIGISLVIALGAAFPANANDIVLTAIILLVTSVPVTFVCLILCFANRVISGANLFVSIAASLFFFVFGYMTVVFVLGASIKAYKSETEE